MAYLLVLLLTLAGVFNLWVAFSEATFSIWHFFGGILFLFIPCFVVIVIIKSIRDARYLNKRLLDLSEAELRAIYDALGSISDEQPAVFRLGRTGLKAEDNGMRIPILGDGVLSPWAGEQVILQTGANELYIPHLEPSQDCEYASLHGEKYIFVGVPRKILKSGKSRNRFQYDYYLQQSEMLHDLIRKAFPRVKPKQVLEFLFETYGKNGNVLGFDGCFIGGYPRWIQEPEFPQCPECGRRMQHLLEIGSNKAAWNRRVGQSYFFSCKTHPKVLQTVMQWD